MEKDQTSQKRRAPRAERVKTEFPARMGHQTGFIKDLSATGIYLEIPEAQEVGSEISLEVDLETSGGTLKLKLTGTVVRLEQQDGRIGMGIKISNQELS